MRTPNPVTSHAYCPVCSTRVTIPIERRGQITYCRRHRVDRDHPDIPRPDLEGDWSPDGIYKIYRDPDQTWSPCSQLSRREIERLARMDEMHPKTQWIKDDLIYGLFKKKLVLVERITA